MADFRKPFRALSFRPKPPMTDASSDDGAVLTSTRSSLINSAIYVDGCRTQSPATLAETYTALDANPDAMA